MLSAFLALALLVPSQTAPAPSLWSGPGKFCGYATAIDLQPGEQVTDRRGAVEVSHYVWSGPFGSIVVDENNWAAAPKRVKRVLWASKSVRILRLRDRAAVPTYAIWDGGHLVAYLSGSALGKPTADLDLLRRIQLVDHAGAKGTGCTYRLMYSQD